MSPESRQTPPEEIGSVEEWRSLLAEWASTSEYSALTRLGRRAHRLAELPPIAELLTSVRVGVASSSTFELLQPVLETALFAVGLRPSFHVAPYGQVAASLLEADGTLLRFQPQVMLALTATLHLPAKPSVSDSLERTQEHIDEVCRDLLSPCAAFHDRTGAEIIIDNFHPLPWRAAGNVGARLPGDLTTFVRRLNLALADRSPRYVHINDVASLAERCGLDRWFDERYWYFAKQSLSFDCVSAYCRQLAAVIGAILGRTRKCLIVDLDNTLWGGVVGDDGVSGIQIGEGSPVGEAFKAFQIYIRELKARGILLAVCSKNDETIARAAFTDHPEMQLSLDDFVAFKANWEPKSENVRAIARELNLGLDSFAFVDDNPAERDEVRQALPEVAIPELPADPSGFVRALDAARLFEVPALTIEDTQRTTTYRARSRMLEELGSTTDIPGYLRSLDMHARVEPFRPEAFDRITQLINKTNQFNLTTPRVVVGDVERLASEPSAITCTVRLRDRFADHGLISVTVGRIDDGRLLIPVWLMSCRVLGRGVERLVFNYLLTSARERGLRELVGSYEPTPRNALVKDHYASLGFRREGDSERWVLAVADAVPATDIFISEERDVV